MTKMEEPLEFYKTYLNADGVEVGEDNAEICAKTLISNRTGNTTFYIKSTSKELFNPTVKSFHYRKNNWKLLKSSQEKYNLYISFLKTKNIKFLTQAERL
jgi:hypothetical protein